MQWSNTSSAFSWITIVKRCNFEIWKHVFQVASLGNSIIWKTGKTWFKRYINLNSLLWGENEKNHSDRVLLYDNGRWLCDTFWAFLETCLPVKAPPNACLFFFFPVEKFRNVWNHLSSSITNHIYLMLLDIHCAILAQPKHPIFLPRKEVKEGSTPELASFYQMW